MAIVITNGERYIYLNEEGKHRSTEDFDKALQFEKANMAIGYMEHAPAKTKGYYVFDTETQKILWVWLTEEERKAKCLKKSQPKSKRRKRHQYSADTRKLIYDKYDGRCQLCGKKLSLQEMTLDHIIPLAVGGVDDISNLWTACESCNQAKADSLPENFFDRICSIFTYQMEIKYKNTLRWKCVSGLLKTLT